MQQSKSSAIVQQRNKSRMPKSERDVGGRCFQRIIAQKQVEGKLLKKNIKVKNKSTIHWGSLGANYTKL